MIFDILIAVILVAIAFALGLTVHPLFWFLVVLAVLWLFGRRGGYGGYSRRW